MRRKDRQRDEDFARALLERAEYAVLSTVNADGSPYCIPISPVMMDGCVYFHCGPAGQKVENIRRDSRVCLTCVGQTRLLPMEFSTEYESAVVHGRAEILEGEEIVPILLGICKKFAPENMENAPKAIAASLHRTRVCKIMITSITGKAKSVG